MFEVINKKDITEFIKEFDIFAPNISKHAKAGQFIIIRLDEKAERIPITITDIIDENTIKIIVQCLGKSSFKIGNLKIGARFLDILGPLGKPAEIKNYGNVVMIAGGVGIAGILPIIKALKNNNNKITSIIGVREISMIMLKDNLEKFSDKIYFTSNDGSLGEKGFTTDVLKRILSSGEKIDIIFAIGPIVMMKAVYELVKSYNISLKVSLEVIMLDGVGMCGACRVKYGNENKFTCIDGPIFDAKKLDFLDILNRQKTYKDKELFALNDFKLKSKCNCHKNFKIDDKIN